MIKAELSQGGWIVTIPVSIMALAYVAFLFLPRMRSISELRQELRQREDFVNQADKLRARAESATSELKLTREYCDLWKSRAVDERQLQAVFSEIGELAEANGARILRFEPQPPVNYERWRKIPVLFNFTAPFDSAEQLARDLEELPAAVQVEHLKIEQLQENGKAVKVEARLVVFADNPEKSD